jgi:hypothetical protein
MPHQIPKYRHYKPKNLGVVRIGGKDHYLGRYDSPEGWEKYHRLIAEHFAGLFAFLPPFTGGRRPLSLGPSASRRYHRRWSIPASSHAA